MIVIIIVIDKSLSYFKVTIERIDNNKNNTTAVYASCLILLTYCYNNMFMLIANQDSKEL